MEWSLVKHREYLYIYLLHPFRTKPLRRNS